MIKKTSFFIFALFSGIIGLYPVLYFLLDRKFGLLSSKPEALLHDTLWNIGFYGHIIPGGLALLIGWIQFNKKWRNKNLSLHRSIGKIYIISVLISALCGFYIALYATGGLISASGFSILAMIWFLTTLLAYSAIRQGNTKQHEKWMIYSYAACFAAVTLRIWLPALMSITNDFVPAYRIVAWLCWVPNLIVAYIIIRRKAL